MRRKHIVRTWGLAVLILVSGGVAPAGAAPPSESAPVERRPAIATFEGKKIDLARGWGEARACLIWRQGGVMECFRSEAALDAREAQLAAIRPERERETTASFSAYASSSYYCSSSLRLYEHNYYAGRRLSFWDRGYWQNLANYGFDDSASSYIVGGCYVHLAEHPNGGGWWYPGPTYPYAGEPVMGWQDVISSIFIE